MATGAELNADGSTKPTASEYRQLVGRIQDWVEYAVPAAETVTVVSRGDEDLVQLGSRPAWHFPRLSDGRYAGYHPPDSNDAISHLEEQRGQGAAYFVLPNTAFWWLDFYEELAQHLEAYELVVSNDDCRIYRLLEEGSWGADKSLGGVSRVPGVTRADGRMLSEFMEKILPAEAQTAVLSASAGSLPSGAELWQPPHRAVTDRDEGDRVVAALAKRGIEYFVIPSGAYEWLEEYPALEEALDSNHRLVTRQEHLCKIYELVAPAEQPVKRISQPTATVPEASAKAAGPSLLQRLGLRFSGRNGR